MGVVAFHGFRGIATLRLCAMSPDSDPIAQQKRTMRAYARARRDSINGTRARAAEQAVEVFLDQFEDLLPTEVAGYATFDSEFDCWPLLRALAGQHCSCALPRMVQDGRLLQFHEWQPDDPLEAGRFGILEPFDDKPQMRPHLVMVPLLAFDAKGFRLGYGGGFYDTTLEHLRAQGEVIAIGYGFSAQQVDAIPHEAHDQPLDWIVTEQASIRPERV